MNWFESFVEPRSIAIVGASGREGSPFARPLELLGTHGYEGAIYPVNPSYESLGGRPCFPDLDSIPGPVDLVLLLVPAAAVPEVIEAAGRKGARAAIVFASGFAETGEDGRNSQRRLAEVGRRAGVRVLGPNCQGVIFGPNRVVATFTAAADTLPTASGFAYVGQSGAVGGSILDLANERGLGVTAWFSVGNEADCTGVEIAAALIEREEIAVVALYLESIDDGAGLIGLADRARELGKVLILLRSGRTDAGWRAGVSHTGAMSRPGRALAAAAERHGIVLVEDIDEMLEAGQVLLRDRRGAGPRVGVVTTSGGAGGIAADHLELAGLSLPELPPELQEELGALVPSFGALANPVDVTAQLFRDGGGDFIAVCESIAASPAVDQVVVVVTMLTGEPAARIAAELVSLKDRATAPIHLCWLASARQTSEARAILAAAGIPVFASLRAAAAGAAVLAVTTVAEPGTWSPSTDRRFAELPELLTEADAVEVLDAGGVPRPRSVLITNPKEASSAVEEVGGRAVLKLQAPELTHKSDAGLVRLDVGPGDAEAIAAELLAAGAPAGIIAEPLVAGGGPGPVDGVLVQEQLAAGFELLVGITTEETGLPPLLTLGSGGTEAEVRADTATASLPLSAEEVEELLMSLRGAKLLRGFRGAPALDVEAAVAAVIATIEAGALLGPRLAELEINPLIVQPRGQGAYAADALVRLKARRDG